MQTCGVIFGVDGAARLAWTWFTPDRACPYTLTVDLGEAIVHLDAAIVWDQDSGVGKPIHNLRLPQIAPTLIERVDTVPLAVRRPRAGAELAYQPGYRRLVHHLKAHPSHDVELTRVRVVLHGEKDSFPLHEVVHVFEGGDPHAMRPTLRHTPVEVAR